MMLWSVYHTITGVITTPIVSYIPPVVWYAHFILFDQVTSFLIIVPFEYVTGFAKRGLIRAIINI